MRALVRRLASEQRGISMVELIVAMAVTSLLLTMVGSFFVTMTKAQQTVSSINQSTRQGTTSMTQLSRYLREAVRLPTSKTGTDPAFVSASGTALQFYSAVDLTSAQAGYTRVTVSSTGGRLVMQLAQGNCASYPCTFAATRTITLADVVRTSAPLFSFVGVDNVTPIGNPTTRDQLDAIRSVQVALTVGSSSSSTANDTTFSATVNLRNLDYGTATNP